MAFTFGARGPPMPRLYWVLHIFLASPCRVCARVRVLFIEERCFGGREAGGPPRNSAPHLLLPAGPPAQAVPSRGRPPPCRRPAPNVRKTATSPRARRTGSPW